MSEHNTGPWHDEPVAAVQLDVLDLRVDDMDWLDEYETVARRNWRHGEKIDIVFTYGGARWRIDDIAVHHSEGWESPMPLTAYRVTHEKFEAFRWVKVQP